MDRELRDNWVTELRSPERRQVTGCLRAIGSDGTVMGECCLGVLCDIDPRVRFEHEDAFTDYTVTGDVAAVAIGDLSQYGEKLFGIPHDIAVYLVHMNDGTGTRRSTFPEIADYIEANL